MRLINAIKVCVIYTNESSSPDTCIDDDDHWNLKADAQTDRYNSNKEIKKR